MAEWIGNETESGKVLVGLLVTRALTVSIRWTTPSPTPRPSHRPPPDPPTATHSLSDSQVSTTCSSALDLDVGNKFIVAIIAIRSGLDS